MNMQQNISLADKNTFKVGGVARWFCVARTVSDLEMAASFVSKHKLPFFILGEGSNILISDSGFAGLVIKMEVKGVKVSDVDWNTVLLEAAAGESWDDVVALSIAKGLYGLENLSYIPGTVGAAPVQNIGAYGSEIKEAITKVEVFNMKKKKLEIMSREKCLFGYRTSIFKSKKASHLIITKVFFELKRTGQVYIGYPDLMERFKERYSKDITPADVRSAVIEIRQKKLPDWKTVGTAGSFFKNFIVSEVRFNLLKKRFPDLPGYAFVDENSKGEKISGRGEKMVKIPAGYVLDKICGLKGWKWGRVGTWHNQALVLVNEGGATAEEITTAAKHIVATVKSKTGLTLLWEVQAVL